MNAITDPWETAALMRVRVVIPCRNEAGFIGRCLSSIIAADRSGMELEVRVVDGLSDDGTREEILRIAKGYPWIQLVDNPERTTPQAMNIGLRAEGYDVGIILGAHAEIDVGFLRENLRLLALHPQAGCTGGVIENIYLDKASRRIGAALGHPFGVGSAHFRTGRKEGEVDTVAFGAYRREVFDQVGFFDERLVRNQDDEFNYRVLKAGWKIILSHKVRSRYYVRASLSRLFRQYAQYGYWKVYVNRLHKSVTTWRQLVPAAFVLYLITGAIVSCFVPSLFRPYLAGVGFYLLAAVFSATQAAKGMKDIPGVALAFVILHSAYGLGYLRGLWELVLLRKDPAANTHRLTR